jgi:hypothetical protein
MTGCLRRAEWPRNTQNADITEIAVGQRAVCRLVEDIVAKVFLYHRLQIFLTLRAAI